jgi:predicted Zn-dependent protease
MLPEAVAKFAADRHLTGSSVLTALLANALAASGDRDEARQLLHELISQARHGALPSDYFAAIYASLGEQDVALAWLERAYDGRSTILVFLNRVPLFDALRAHARFTDLVRRIRLPV